MTDDVSSAPFRIVSGGQTGPDRAALDVALARGVPCGGWCPAGRWAEDGPIPPVYPVRETPSADPAERTRRNVAESDASLILSPSPVWGGTALTASVAAELGRLAVVVDPRREGPDRAAGILWPAVRAGGQLNVAGPRESEAPGLRAASAAWLHAFLDACRLLA